MRSNHKKNHAKQVPGFSLIELFLVIVIISFTLTLFAPGFHSFFSRSRVAHAARTVTAALNTARYKAIMQNKSIKVTFRADGALLQEKIGSKWQGVTFLNIDEQITVIANNAPVFSPLGEVAPLCSIEVYNDDYHYKITLTMAGLVRIKQWKVI